MKKYISAQFLLDKAHIYLFVVSLFVGLICGIVGGALLSGEFFATNIYIFVAILLCLASFIKFRKIFIIVIFLAGMFFGLWRSDNFAIQKNEIKRFYGSEILFSGKVVDDTTTGKNGELSFKIKNIVIEQRQFAGEIWVSSHENYQLERSDTVTIKGVLKDGFGGFFASISAAEILEVNKSSKQDLGLVTRDKFAEATSDIQQPERSLGLGILLGQKTALPEDLSNNIALLGLSHIVVASGYNLTILVAFARKLFSKVSKYLSAVFGGMMIGGFILVSGFSPSMNRAGLVAGLSLVAWYYGRKIHPATLLLVSAGVTLFFRPSYIWGDLGWYLSFSAFAGVLILAPLLHHFFWGVDHKPSWFRELVVATISAQIMTLPLIVYTFGGFSAYSLIANILILPVVPFVMGAVFLAGVMTLIIPFASGIFALPATFLLSFCTFVVDKVSSLPGVLTEINLSILSVSLMYLSLAILIIMLKLKTKHNFLKDKMIID